MKKVDRFLIGALAAGVWALVGLQSFAIDETYAQDEPEAEQVNQVPTDVDKGGTVIYASDIVGLSTLIEQVARNRAVSPQSMPGLDQYIKSVVRGCRVNGSISGSRISSASISC